MLSNEIPSPNQEEKRVIIVKNSKSVIFDGIWQFTQQLCIKISKWRIAFGYFITSHKIKVLYKLLWRILSNCASVLTTGKNFCKLRYHLSFKYAETVSKMVPDSPYRIWPPFERKFEHVNLFAGSRYVQEEVPKRYSYKVIKWRCLPCYGV